MLAILSTGSKNRLSTCDPRLQKLVNAACANAPMDFMIVFGHRTKEQQETAVARKTSKLHWPRSKHNAEPALAFDFAPMIDGLIPWGDLTKFEELALHFKAVAITLGIHIIWGGDYQHQPPDWDHIELADKWPVGET